MTKGKKQGGKPKQTKIPGTERKDVHEDIEEAAAEYVEIRDERMQYTKKEVAAQAKLLAAMKLHKLDTYRCDREDLEVKIVSKDEKARVKRVDAGGEVSDDDEFGEPGAESPL